LAFAATGMKVLIIDCDLRRPRQHALFRVGREDGLADLLAGLLPIESTIKPHLVEQNLFIMPAGRQSPLAPSCWVRAKSKRSWPPRASALIWSLSTTRRFCRSPMRLSSARIAMD
jgi:Mrp family chromosome partitioning ATPase